VGRTSSHSARLLPHESGSGRKPPYTVYVGDERLSLTAGSLAFGPHGVPHTFIAETDGATVLVGFQPFQFEGFIREVGEPAAERVLPPPPERPPDMERLLPIAARNGFNILGPPGPPPRPISHDD
jgi:AraC-like ligand binding domain